MNNKGDNSIRNERIATLQPRLVALDYSIVLKRLVHGYSKQDLTFLLGFEYDHLTTVAALKGDVQVVMEIFGLNNDCSTNWLLNAWNEANAQSETYKSVEWQESGYIYYEVYRVDEAGNECLVYKVFEATANMRTADAERRKKAREALNRLIADGWLDEPCTALALVNQCRFIGGYDIQPSIVASLLAKRIERGALYKLEVPEDNNLYSTYYVLKTPKRRRNKSKRL